jgi:hypothetical protein
MDKAAQDNRTNQCNPDHKPTGPGKVQHSFVHGSPHWNPILFYNWKELGAKGTCLFPLWHLTVYRLSAGNTSNNRNHINNGTFDPLKTKRRLLYLKTQSVPRCKHFSSRL